MMFSGKHFDTANHFINDDGLHIFCKYWTPEDKKGLMLIIHGLGEHCGRYDPIAETFTDLGLVTFSHDHVGHGESEGYRGDISSYDIFMRDLLQHIKIMKEKYSDLPLHLFGHSLGGGLAILLAHQNPWLFRSVILSAPLISKHASLRSNLKMFMMKHLSYFAPKLPVGYLDTNMISRSTAQVSKYKSDPLVYHGAILIRMAYQLACLSDEIEKALPQITFSFFVLHGDADGLCDISGSRQLIQQAQSKDKAIQEFKDAYHELMHEIDDIPKTFLHAIRFWLNDRL